MVYVLFGAVVAAAAVGGVRSFAGSAPPPRDPAPIAAAPEAQAAPGAAADEEATGNAVSGEVLEVIDVPNYSYLRLGKQGTEGTWVAVPTTKVAVGTKVTVQGAMEMQNFKSTALNRTFASIYFGTLAGGASGHGAGDMKGKSPHGASGADPHASGADPHGGATDPHASAGQGPAAVEVKAVPRAEGPNGKTVADVIAQRDKLAGKTVKIRGTVVKSTTGIMDKTYLHLRDGSGDAAKGTNDITVTTTAEPKVGDVIVVEGNVATDVDIGSGYKFPTLVSDAKVSN
jgi:hypothetical protein